MGLLDWLWRGLTETSPPRRRSPGRKRSGRKTKSQDDLTALARRLERGEIRGEELRQLMARGMVRVGRRNPQSEREAAIRLAKEFHGTAEGHIVELEPAERRTPRYGVVVGELTAVEYQPLRGSRRGGMTWRHESGDRGETSPRSRHRPLLVVDPLTRRLAIVPHRSPLRFSSKRGLVG